MQARLRRADRVGMHWPLGSPCPRFVSNRCPKDERGIGNQTGRRNFFAWPLPGSMALWAGLGAAVRSAVLDQAVELHADVGGLRGGIGERDGLVEGGAGLPRARPSCSSSAPFTPKKWK